MARDISEVNLSSGLISQSSSRVSNSADELKTLASNLNKIVGKFKTRVNM